MPSHCAGLEWLLVMSYSVCSMSFSFAWAKLRKIFRLWHISGKKKDRQHLDDAVSPMESVSFRSDDDRPVAHARGGADGRQEGRERGYYHLHRQLDDTLLFHGVRFFFFRRMRRSAEGRLLPEGRKNEEGDYSVVRWCGGQPLPRLEARDYSGGGWSALRVSISPPKLGGVRGGLNNG